MACKQKGENTKLRVKGFKCGEFIHCYAFILNFLLSRSAEKGKRVKMFILQLRSFSKF